jgi:lipopolysaccharide export system protein LptA
VKPEPTDTVIHCEGGMYFDPDEGVLVYLKNVTVKDPRFNLSGANELKVFFGKKPPKEESKNAATTDGTGEKPAKEDPAKSVFGGGVGANFGDVERIVATGAVLLDQKPAKEGDEPIQASGAIFSYNIKADQVIISGGYPWVVKGKQRLRAKEPNLNLRISPKAGSFVTEGDWETIFNLEQKK